MFSGKMRGKDGTLALYDLRIKVERLKDGGDYRFMATSRDLPNLVVAGDSEDEVLALAPSGRRAHHFDESGWGSTGRILTKFDA